MLTKLIPYQVNASLLANSMVSLSIVTAPSNNFVPREEAEKDDTSRPAIVNERPPTVIDDEKTFDAEFVEVDHDQDVNAVDSDQVVNDPKSQAPKPPFKPDDGGVIIMGSRRRHRPFGSE
jgi:hypothetical protein